MSNGIKLIFDEARSTGDKLKFSIENTKRDVHYTINVGEQQIILKSSLRPEWDSDSSNVLFIQGSAREYDNDFVEIPRKNLKYFLFAILQYNISVGELDNQWVDRYKFKCKHCNKIVVVSNFDQTYFEYCLECKDKLKMCNNCGRIGAEYDFANQCFCSHCVILDSYCQICETEHKVTREIIAKVNGDYHGDEKYINSCGDCCTKTVDFGREMHYHFKPEQYNFLDYDFKKNKIINIETPLNNKLYMGTEIEAQFEYKKHPNVVIGKILKINDSKECELIFAKHDGTIPDPGSEIVTHPMTLNMFRALTWEELFGNIIAPTTKGIGGHVHINKTAFVSPLHVYKFCKFIRTNVEYIEWIAERHLQAEWCRDRSDNGKVVQIAKRFRGNKNGNRYEMINFTAQTIELRFFWSPSNAGMLLKNVEFIDALYNFSRDTKLHFDYKEFEIWVEKSCAKYPYFYNFILKRNTDIVFKENVENFSTAYAQAAPIPQPSRSRVISVDEISQELPICHWCEDEIGGEPVVYENYNYHPNCYDDMIEDMESSPEPDDYVYDEDAD